jgi:hypothetical protein
MFAFSRLQFFLTHVAVSSHGDERDEKVKSNNKEKARKQKGGVEVIHVANIPKRT